jgi:hypothetical protein
MSAHTNQPLYPKPHPSQGIYFIPKSKIGITLGLGVYEKLLNSKVYNNDIGVKLEIGIKF